MSTNTTAEENGSVESLDERDARALTEYMSVLDNVGRARDAPGFYTAVGQNGGTYLVDVETGSCECPDHEYRAESLGPNGCKHERRVAFATGERSIPAWVDRDEIDPHLGEHVDGEVRFVATDGGQAVLDEAERPEGCDCGVFALDGELPCWSCFRVGFEHRNPDPPEREDDRDAYCKACGPGEPATHTVVVNAPSRAFAEDPACQEHAEESRGRTYIREVREGYEE